MELTPNTTTPLSAAKPIGSPVEWDELFSRWAANLRVRPKSVETYTCAVRQFLSWLREHGGTAEPGQQEILAYRQFLAETKKPATIQIYIVALRRFFQWLAAEGAYKNIAEQVEGAKVERHHRKDYLTVEQAKSVLGRIPQRTERDLRDYAILLLMITGGLRDIDVSLANVEDIAAAEGNAVLYLRGRGGDEKSDGVKLTEPVLTAINNYLRRRGGAESGAPLFAGISRNSCGSRLTTRSISRMAKQRLLDAGYDSDRLTAHSFRHSAISLALLGGASLQETQQLARHTNISSTLMYARNLERPGNSGADVVTEAVFT